MIDLDTSGGWHSYARGVSADGNVVVGQVVDAANNYLAFRWTQATGMQTINQWLADNGVDTSTLECKRADSVSADGNVVVGQLANRHAFLAIVGPRTNVISAIAGAGGSISPAGNVTVNYGESQSFLIIPDKYYRILDVTVDGESVGSVKQYTFYNVTEDHTITATFVLTNIAVESPNGGESLNAGTSQNISWTYIDNPGKVISIELIKGGTLFKTINPGVAIGKSGSALYKWHIQSKLPTGNDYQIRISSKDNSDFWDTSNNFFSIQ